MVLGAGRLEGRLCWVGETCWIYVSVMIDGLAIWESDYKEKREGREKSSLFICGGFLTFLSWQNR